MEAWRPLRQRLRQHQPPAFREPLGGGPDGCLAACAPHVAPHHGVEPDLVRNLGRRRRQGRLLGRRKCLQLGTHARGLRRGQRPHPALGAAPQQLEGEQPAAEGQVEHHAVALQGSRPHDAVTVAGQAFAGAGEGALQPAVQLPLQAAAGVGENLAARFAGAVGALPGGRQVGLAAALHLHPNLSFMAHLSGLIKHLPLELLGKVLLRHPVLGVGVGVTVAGAVAEALGVAAGVAQRRRDRRLAFGGHGAQRVEEPQRAVALGRGGQVQDRLGQVEATLGQADVVERGGAGGHHLDRRRVRHADVLRGKDQHAPEQIAWILAGVDHARHPVQGGVRVGAAQALDEGADGVVVGVALLVVQHRAALDRLLGHRPVHAHHSVARRRGRGDRQLQGVEQAARIAVGDVEQVLHGVTRHLAPNPAQAALGVGQRGPCHPLQVVAGQRLQLEDAAAAHQRLDHLEVGVLRGGSDQHDGAVLHRGQQRVLLRLVPAVHLVHEQDGAPAVQVARLARRRNRLAQLLDPGQDGVQCRELRPGGAGDHLRQGGLAGSRRPVEDQGGELIRLDRAPQQAPRADDVPLTHEFVQGARPHARRQRRTARLLRRAAGAEQVFVTGVGHRRHQGEHCGQSHRRHNHLPPRRTPAAARCRLARGSHRRCIRHPGAGAAGCSMTPEPAAPNAGTTSAPKEQAARPRVGVRTGTLRNLAGRR